MSDLETAQSEQTRRNMLLMASAGAVVASGTFVAAANAQVLGHVLSQARVSGKPPLTTATLNAILQQASQQQGNELYDEIRRDPKAFMRAHFTLSAQQNTSVEGLTANESAAIGSAVDAATREHRMISSSCSFGTPSATLTSQRIHVESQLATGAASGPIVVHLTGFQ